jgi:hypothetical protein
MGSSDMHPIFGELAVELAALQRGMTALKAP